MKKSLLLYCFFFISVFIISCTGTENESNQPGQEHQEQGPQDHLLEKGMSSHFIMVNDSLKMHYVKVGEGPKLMVMVHGFPEFWYGYNPLLKKYIDSKEYTVIAPDMRGYNLTDKPKEIKDYQVKNMVGDLNGLVKGLGFEKFTLVGHDWGGYRMLVVCHGSSGYAGKFHHNQLATPFGICAGNERKPGTAGRQYLYANV